MNNNDYEQTYTYDRGTYYSVPRWNDFTSDDERRAKRRFSRFFLALFLFLLISQIVGTVIVIALAILLGESYIPLAESSWFALTLNSLVLYGIAFPILFLIVKGMKKTIRVRRGIRFSELFKIFLVSQAFMYFGSIIGETLNIFFGSFTGVMPENSTSELILNSNIGLIFVTVVILGPIVEELIFRKLLMDRLGIYGDRLAIFVSAIAFGLFHGNLYQFFYAMLLGLVLSYLYSKTSNIWLPIALHSLINFLGSIVPMLLSDGLLKLNEITESMMGAEQMTEETMLQLYDPSVLLASMYMPLQLAMVIAGTIIFFKNKRRIFVSDRCEICIPKARRKGVIFGNPGVIMFLVICGLTITANLMLPAIEAFLAEAAAAAQAAQIS